jgi:hypothetical protein
MSVPRVTRSHVDIAVFWLAAVGTPTDRPLVTGSAPPCTLLQDISYPVQFLPFFSEVTLVSDSQTPNARNDHEKTSRARQAAEDLFKPKQQTTRVDPPISASSVVLSVEGPSRRQPRIFTVQPPMPKGAAKAEAPAKPKPIRQQPAIRRETREIPASQQGRVRALTRYGMTKAQVARLYEVGVDEIERIIRGSTTSRRASA